MVTLQTHSPPNGRGEKGVAELGESPGLLNLPFCSGSPNLTLELSHTVLPASEPWVPWVQTLL